MIVNIEGIFPSYFSRIPEVNSYPRADSVPLYQSLYHPSVVVDISPEGRAAYDRYKTGMVPTGGNTNDSVKGMAEVFSTNECQTCKSRKYQDVSNDSSVSFQAPTHINPSQAGAAVASHEREHVANEQAKAEKEDRKIVSQTVTLSSSICPECGRVYISGGVTRTLTASKQDNSPEVPEETA